MQRLPTTCHTRANPLRRLRRETSQVTWTSLIQRKRPGQTDVVTGHDGIKITLTANFAQKGQFRTISRENPCVR